MMMNGDRRKLQKLLDRTRIERDACFRMLQAAIECGGVMKTMIAHMNRPTVEAVMLKAQNATIERLEKEKEALKKENSKLSALLAEVVNRVHYCREIDDECPRQLPGDLYTRIKDALKEQLAAEGVQQ